MTRNRPEYVCDVLAFHLSSIVCAAYVDQIRLVSHMQVVNHGRFIQVRKLRHIICLVELCRIDFVNALGVGLSLLKCH